MTDLRNIRTPAVSRADASIDQGLRSYMLSVYNLMALGLVITAFASMAMAWALENNSAMQQLFYGSPLRYVIIFAPLVAVFFLSFNLHKLQTTTAQILFFVYAALIGVSLSSIFLVYTSSSIAQTFFITAASFGALSLYGYSTKRDLRPLGSFLFIAVIGLLLSSIVNIFLQSSAFMFGISIVGVLVFAGLTAYDTQAIKEMYFEGDDRDTMGRKVVLGALKLYLDFINMFVFLLNLLGNQRN